MTPKFEIFITTCSGEKIFAFTWSRSDIWAGLRRAEREAVEFGYAVKEVSYRVI